MDGTHGCFDEGLAPASKQQQPARRTSCNCLHERSKGQHIRSCLGVSRSSSQKRDTSFVIDAEWRHPILRYPFTRNALVKQGRTYQDLLRGCMLSLLLDCLFDFLLARLIGYSIWLEFLFDFLFAL